MKIHINFAPIIVFGIIGIILCIFIMRKLKFIKVPCVSFISGAPKTGKTALMIYLGKREYRKNVISWHIGKCFYWFKNHSLLGYPLKPMLYCNIPLACKHNPLTKDILLRQVRIPNKSVVLIDETSLLADSQYCKDKVTNDQLLLFFKLFGHYSHGGCCIMSSHNVNDCHYSIKRALGTYIYIYETNNKIPFFALCKCRELIYSDTTNVVNDISEDAELSMRKVLYLKRAVYSKYDCFCYSIFTDNLVLKVNYDYKFDKKDLKAKKIVSFNPSFESLRPTEVTKNENN